MGFLILRFRCNCAFWLLWSQSSWQELYQPRRAEPPANLHDKPSERAAALCFRRAYAFIHSNCIRLWRCCRGLKSTPSRPSQSLSFYAGMPRRVFLPPSASPPNIHSLQPFGGDRLQLANAWKALKDRCWFAVTSWKAGPQSKQLHVGYILAILSDFVFADTLI